METDHLDLALPPPHVELTMERRLHPILLAQPRL